MALGEEKSVVHSSKKKQVVKKETWTRKARYESYLTPPEMIKIDRPLSELDPAQLKTEILRWASAVALYANHLTVLSRTLSSSPDNVARLYQR